MNVCIDTQGFDISMGTGSMIFLPGGGIKGNISILGNVGIGKSTPTAALDISGIIKTNIIDTQNFDISMGTGGIRFATANGATGGLRGNIFINGNVGIGKSTPTAALDISGIIKTNTIDTQNFDISMGTGGIRYTTGSITPNTAINYDWISRASTNDTEWYSVCFGNGLFVAVSFDGSGTQVMTSPDGTTWTPRYTPGGRFGWRSVCFGYDTNGNPLFVAVASSNGTGGRVMTSPDGITWTQRNAIVNTYDWLSVCYANGTFVATGYNSVNTSGYVMYSTNGISWTTGASAGGYPFATQTFYSVIYGGTRFVAVGSDYAIYSTDGINWTRSLTIPTGGTSQNGWRDIAYGNGLYVAVSGSPGSATQGTGGQNLISRVMTSPDGNTWTSRSSPDNASWYSVAFGGGVFIASGINGIGSRTMSSTDAINWVLRPSVNDTLFWRKICYGNNLFVGVASNGYGNRVMTLNPNAGITASSITTDETTTQLMKFGQNGATLRGYPSKNYRWYSRSSSNDASWGSVCYGNGTFVAVATFAVGTSKFMTSPDGYTWTSRSGGTTANIWQTVCYGELSGNNIFVAVSNTGTNRVITSTDNGVTWVPCVSSVETTSWQSVCFGYDTNGNGRFVAVSYDGSSGRVMTSPNGINWTLQTSATAIAGTWYSVCYGYDATGLGAFVAVGTTGSTRAMWSRDGITWTGATTADGNASWLKVCYGNGTFVAVAGGNGTTRIMYSTNGGQSWVGSTYPVTNSWTGVCFGDGLFVTTSLLSGTGNRAMTSTDGINWIERSSSGDHNWNSVCYGNGTFVAVSYTSGVGNQVMTNDYNLYDNATIINGPIYAVGGGSFGAMTTSPLQAGLTIASKSGIGNSYIGQLLKLGVYSTEGGSSCSAIQSTNFFNNNDLANHLILQPLGGNVGIGVTTPAVQLDLSTDGARKLTTTTWTTGSDRRIKEDITDADLDLCYSVTKNLKLRRFKWKDYVGYEHDKHVVGYIAQEVKDVFPKAVTESKNVLKKKNENGEIVEEEIEDFLTLNVDQIQKTLHGAIQKLMKIVEQQQIEIEALMVRGTHGSP